MPNTLVHLGVQGGASRALLRDVDVKWIFLGCMLPDVPWILWRASVGLGVPVHPSDLLLYAGAQASLAGCLVLACALACLARRPWTVFALLAGNALVHLLLDAVEIKPGNGVHLLAPLSWRMTTFELIWPDDPRTGALAVAGGAVAAWMLWRGRGRPIALACSFPRAGAAAALLAVYFAGPLPFLDDLESRDPYSVRTLRNVDRRVGRDVALDRRPLLRSERGYVVISREGEPIRVLGLPPTRPGTVSLWGTFVAPDAITVRRIHPATGWPRDGFNYLGLALVAGAWAGSLVAGAAGSPVRRSRPASPNPPSPGPS